ncbi:MAG TPA: HAD family hydrolase [Candidatus Nanoarchaeia archaeon]|nr:HAD family hydrolase [Candidatus Nanoarchaeia archaeon]
MKIEVFAFDWSGVISDDRRPVYEANMRLMEHYGLPRMTFEEWLPQTTASAVEFMANHGVRADRARLFDLYTRFFNAANAEGIVPTVYSHAADVLNSLKRKGRINVVLSAHPAENLMREAREYGLEQFLTSITGSSSNKADSLREIVAQHGVKPEAVLYSGDTIYDIRHAKQAGVRSAGIVGGYHTRERLADENPDVVGELPVIETLV